jgi:leader peptidase (prepilin peptidase)/N-methyltransferase
LTIKPPLRQTLPSLALPAVAILSLIAAPGAEGLWGAFLGTLMLAIATRDFDRYVIPNELTASAAALALVRALTTGPDAGWLNLLWAAGRGSAVALPLLTLMVAYRWWRGRDGLGMGDVKLAGVAGAWLGLTTVFAVIEVATLSALAAYFIHGTLRRRPLKSTAFLPFGLFLAPAIWLGWLAETIMG